MDGYWDYFEDDYSLGAVKRRPAVRKVASATKRLVVLSGTATFNQTIGNPSGLNETMKNALVAEGFEVVSVSVSKQVLFGQAINISLQINVFNNFTAEQARQRAIQVLSETKRWWLYAGNTFNVLTDVELKVVADYKTITTEKEVTAKNNSTWTVPNLTKKVAKKASNIAYDASKAVGNTALETVKDSATGMFGNMGYTLPIAAVITLVVVLIAVKK